MKKILLIATGGTIASKPTAGGLVPQITSEEILNYVPQVAQIAEIDTLQLFNLDSTNINWQHWLKIAECVEEHYAEYDGFVITHGTDTMAYTIAALSYLVQNSAKPIVMTGSQKSIYEEDTDARNNLTNAFLYAADEYAQGVKLVFDGKVIMGTRARKSRTKSYNAFSSIDYPEIAVIRDRRIIYFIEESKPEGAVKFYHKLDPKVFVLKLTPGLDAGIFEYLTNYYDAVIIESFGVGGLPCYGNEEFLNSIERWLAKGKIIVMATQVSHEGSDMEVYQVGKKIKDQYELIEAYNMTVEAVLAKLMWILPQTKEQAKVAEMFYQPIAKDIL